MTKLTESARGEPCTLQLPYVCLHMTGKDPERETTVLAHIRELTLGAGMGIKPPDSAAVYACGSCHDYLDGRRPYPDECGPIDWWRLIAIALVRTHERMLHKGALRLAGP